VVGKPRPGQRHASPGALLRFGLGDVGTETSEPVGLEKGQFLTRP